MALTKPAGCAVQLIGAPFFLGGLIGLLGQHVFIGAAATLFGLLLLLIGRRPALK